MGSKSALAEGYILAHPGEFLRLSAMRVVRFWAGAGSDVNSGIVELHAVLTSLLGLLGLTVVWRQSRTTAVLFLLPVLVFPLPYYVTHPDFRFRLLLDPLLTILSAYAVCWLRSLWKDVRLAPLAPDGILKSREPTEKRTSGAKAHRSFKHVRHD
jgi:hypothetical protein